MDIFNDFVEHDMLEQIRVLEQVVMDNDVQAVIPLLGLYGSHECDQAVEEVIYHALQQLMKGSDVAVTRGLNHPSIDIQLLALRCGCDRNSVQFQSYLVEKLQKTTDPVLLAEIIRSMATFAEPELITILLPYINHNDSAVAGSCIDLLSSLGGERARDGLLDLVQREIDNLDQLGGCSFVAALGLGCLSRFSDDKTIQFLVTNIHHDSPTFRRLIGETIIKIGRDCIPALIQCIQSGDIDEKIMAANSIGFIRHRKGAELLIAELTAEYAFDINVRFAMYEAIGRINCLRSALCLSDALATENDEFIVNAVLVGLERLCHPGLAKVFSDLVTDTVWTKSIVRRLIALRSKNILKVIYNIPEYRLLLLHEIATKGDKKANHFCESLFKNAEYPFRVDHIQSEYNEAHDSPFRGKRIVVVDDSKAIIRFYCEVASTIGCHVISVYDGQEALDYFQQEKHPDTIDLLLTDMNMPNKDGIELVKEVRQIACFQDLPILMATTESESLQRDVALEAGVSQFIRKPFTRDVLIDKLQQMLLAS